MRHHDDSMAELELIRAPDDRRLYALEGFGTLRLMGFWSRSAVATSGSRTWQLTGTGILRRFVRATDESGTEVGAFEPRRIHRGGEVRWGDRDYVLRPSSAWRERYVLAEGDRELALLDGKGWGKRPVLIMLTDPAIDPGLLLFAAFVVRGLAEDASGAAGGAASVAATSGSC
jgi:hypothetical protein